MHVQHVQYGNRCITGFLYGDERISLTTAQIPKACSWRNQRGGEQNASCNLGHNRSRCSCIILWIRLFYS
ncbi:hypothetical protein D3C75_989930 [compost metagenome]